MLDLQEHTTLTADTIYQSYLANYEKHNKFQTVLKFCGEFTVNLIRRFADGIEQVMLKNKDKKGTIKKMFGILIEGLQNIHLHGSVDHEGIQKAFIIVLENQFEYKIVFGNIVDRSDRESIQTYIKNLNAQSNEEIKKLYLHILKNGYLSKKGGAGLGVVTMRLKSANKLKHEIYSLDYQKSFLVMEISLSKE